MSGAGNSGGLRDGRGFYVKLEHHFLANEVVCLARVAHIKIKAVEEEFRFEFDRIRADMNLGGERNLFGDSMKGERARDGRVRGLLLDRCGRESGCGKLRGVKKSGLFKWPVKRSVSVERDVVSMTTLLPSSTRWPSSTMSSPWNFLKLPLWLPVTLEPTKSTWELA